MAQFSQSKPAPTWVRNVLDYWHKAEIAVAIIAFSLIALLLIYDVMARELFSPLLDALGFGDLRLALYGSQKIATYLLIVGAFTGIGIATWTGVQLVPKVGFGAAPQAWNEGMNRLADVVTALFLLGVSVVALRFVWESQEIGLKGTGGVDIEIWKVQMAIPLGFASAVLRYAAFAIWPGLKPEPEENLE